MRNILLAALILGISAAAVLGGVVVRNYHFDNPSVIETGDRTYIEMAGCQLTGIPGQPAMPAYGISILLPPGEAIVSVEVSTGERIVTATGVFIDPVQMPIIISKFGPFSPTPPDAAIYSMNGLFPQDLSQNVRTEYMCGYSLGYLALVPAQYNPALGEVSYYPDITVRVITAPSEKAAAAHNQNYRGKQLDRMRLTGKVENPETAETYGEIITAGTDEPEFPYLLITTETLHPAFQPLIDFKTECGLTVEVVYVDDIYSTYGGSDHQSQIRNCIIDYYQNYAATYVLLGGDVEFLPHRGLWATLAGETDNDIPGDIYYGGLDGNWDSNSNGNFGEEGEGDLAAEVIIGRASVGDLGQAGRFVNKQMMYQTAPVEEEIETALMAGEDLGWTIWGSDLKEEVRLGTGATAGFPANFFVRTLYDIPGWSWSAMGDLLPILNSGPNIVNHMGHANTDYMMKFYNSGVNDNNMTNNGVNHNFYIVYSQGCYCGSFDNRTTSGSYTTADCITELFSSISNGAVAMITNSRYGWGEYSSTNGPSQYYDREFFDALFGEDISKIGEVNQDSKEDNIPFMSNATLWCYYEINLFADPTLDIWTAAPVTLNPSYNPAVFVGQSEFTITVPGMEGALCAITLNGELLGSAYTNASGEAEIEFSGPIVSMDTLSLMVTAHNCIPYSGSITVITPDMPYMVVEEALVNDEDTGDNDQILDLGETAYLSVTFSNVGLQQAVDVTGTLNIDDEYVTIIDDNVTLGNFTPVSTQALTEAFCLAIAENAPDGHEITAIITLRDEADSTWVQEFDFVISAPIAQVYGTEIGDADMRLNPGDTCELTVSLVNNGSGEVRDAAAVIMTDSPYLTFNASQAGILLITGGETGELLPAFNLTVSADCPDNIVIPVYLEISDNCGYQAELILELAVGGFFDNFENGLGEWTHNSVTLGWEDQWDMVDYSNYSPGGVNSWHFGIDGGNYGDHTDGGLVTPVMLMEQDAKLTFWHKMQAEESSAYPGQCYDGGIVEMSLNGSAYFQIIPEGGYPYAVRYGSSGGCALMQGALCYSGEFDWQQAVFDLSIYPAGDVRFRFRFSSDGGDNMEGWFVDDVEFIYLSEQLPPSNVQADLNVAEVHLTWNSPNANPPEFGVKGSGQRDAESLQSYKVYRDSQVIAENIGTLEYYDDLTGMPEGAYAYQVSAVYAEGESELSPEIIVNYPEAGVNIGLSSVPEVYFLDQNFPNPFNPQTNFRFGLPEGSYISLVIYNIQGQETAKLAEGYRPAGYYNIVWDAEAMPSGIYFFRLEAGSFVKSGKMLLLK